MRSIYIEDKEQIDRIRKLEGHELSSHAFASLFLWQENMKLSIDISEEGFLVQTEENGLHGYFYPCGTKEAQLRYVKQLMEEPMVSIYYMREEDMIFLEENFPGEFSFRKQPESDEYIFDRDGLMTLQGSVYLNVRRQVKRLFRDHQVEVHSFCEEDADQVAALIARNSTSGHHAGYGGITDDGMPERVFTYRKELGLCGVTIRVDGEVRAVVFGFRLTEDTIDACMECHDKGIYGLACYTQMVLLLCAPDQFRYMNVEEDLGIPGLRMLKRHFHPCRMNHIYTATRHKG